MNEIRDLDWRKQHADKNKIALCVKHSYKTKKVNPYSDLMQGVNVNEAPLLPSFLQTNQTTPPCMKFFLMKSFLAVSH